MRLVPAIALVFAFSSAGAGALPADPGLNALTPRLASARASCPWGTSRDSHGQCRAFVTCAPGAYPGRDGKSCFKRC